MSSRISYALAVCLLLLGACLRFWQYPTLPAGFSAAEVDEIRIAETVRTGRVEVLYDLNGMGREGLYNTVLSVFTSVVGGGRLGFRLLSLWVNVFALAVVYALVRWLYNPLAALVALALLTVNQYHILLSRLVARETILPLVVAFVLLALAYALAMPRFRVGRTTTTPFTALGLAIGVSFYIHPTAFPLTLLTLIFIAYIVLSRQPLSRRKIGYIAFALVIMLVVGMPYIISSIRLPELGGAARLFTEFPIRQPMTIQAFAAGLGGVFLVGDASAVYNLPRRPLIDIVSGLFVIVGLLVCLRYARRPRYLLPLVAAFTLLPTTLLLASSPNFLAMTPLLPLIALFCGVGVSTIAYSLPGVSRPLLYVGLLALFAFNLGWTGRDLFTLWVARDDVQTAYRARLGEFAQYLDTSSARTPVLLCGADVSDAPDVDSYELLTLMLHRQDIALRFVNCQNSLVFTNGGEPQRVILLTETPLEQMHPYLRAWLEQGDVIETPDLPPQSVIQLDVSEALADTIGRFTTTAPAFYPPEAEGGTTYPPVRFGGNLAFLGYEPVDTQAYRPGDYVNLASYWRVDGFVPTDLRLFTHILLDPTEIAAQTDVLSASPSLLQPRDVVLQMTLVRIPFALPEGSYRLSIGAYENNTGMRLSVFDGEQPRATRLFLSAITVER